MVFDPSKPFVGYDRQVPIFGSLVASGEMRENLRAVATLSRGSQEPVTPAQLRGDTRKFPVNLSVKTTLRVKIDAAAYHNIDISTGGPGSSSPAARTLSDIVWKINDRLNAHLSTVGVVYAFDSEGYLLIRSINTDPAVSRVGIDSVVSIDAQTKVHFLEIRGVSVLPYEVTRTDTARGQPWLSKEPTYQHVENALQLRVDRPARLLGNSTGPFNLTVKKWLRLQIDGGAINEIDLTVGGASGANARTLADVAARINTVVGSTVAYAHSKGLLIQSTTTGAASQVKIDRPQSSGYEDATPVVLGFEAGDGDKVWNKYPIIDNGQKWNSTWVRGAEDKPGIGSWGPPAQSKSWLNTVHAGAFHGEFRTSVVSRVTYAWDSVANNWLLAGPAGLRHVEFDSVFESYKVRHATHPWYGFLVAESNKIVVPASVRVGDLIELTDSRREDYPATTSSGVSLQREHDGRDNFDRANASTLTTSSGGDAWVQTAGVGDGWAVNTNRAFLGSGAGGYLGGSDYAILNYALATEQDVAVLCSISSKTASANADSKPCEIGVIVRAIDAANCVRVTIDDRGTIKVIRRVASVDATLQTFTAGGDPPLDTTERTLRVRTTSGNQLSVYWGGPFDPTDWGAEDAVPGSFESRFLVGTVAFTSVGGGDTKSGFYGKVDALSAKQVFVNGFIGRNRATSDLAGLPAVPGNNLRHIITSVRNPDDTADTGTIQDCTPDKPLLLRDDAGAGGIILKQTTASRQIKAMLGGPALKMLGSGFHLAQGDPALSWDNSDEATYGVCRLTVGPGFAVVPTGLAYPTHEVRWLDTPATIGLHVLDAKYRAPLSEGSGPTNNRFYYVYVTSDGTANGIRVEYSLNPPNARGELTQEGKYLRFVGTIYWQGPTPGTSNGIRGFYRSAGVVRYTRPTVTGLSSSGYSIFDNGDISTNFSTINLFDTGSTPKKVIPVTANLFYTAIYVNASVSETYLQIHTSTDQGSRGLIAVTGDDDGEYTLACGPTGTIRAKKSGNGIEVGASVIGYYEDPFCLPSWLG